MNKLARITERQNLGEKYLSLNIDLDILVYTEEGGVLDDERFANGNYFWIMSSAEAIDSVVLDIKLQRRKMREKIYNADFPVSDDLIIHIPRI